MMKNRSHMYIISQKLETMFPPSALLRQDDFSVYAILSKSVIYVNPLTTSMGGPSIQYVTLT